MPGTYRRARRLVVVRTLSATATTTTQLDLVKQHRIEAEPRWSKENFAFTAHYYRILLIKTDNQARTAADPIPRALIKTPADVPTKLSQVGSQ